MPTEQSARQKTLDDCDRPACADVVAMFQKAQESQQQANTDQQKPEAASCPPGSASLGRSSWTLLHSMAAWYPDHPSEDDRRRMKDMVLALAAFYPCSWCAQDFRKHVAEEPVRTESRESLCLWMCEQHNHVNRKLGKPVFVCNMKDLDERWRQSSDPSCQQPKH